MKRGEVMVNERSEGWEFGFEECKEWWRHRPGCYDENGYAKDERLKAFFRDEVFLKPEEFDYSSIKSRFIPGK